MRVRRSIVKFIKFLGNIYQYWFFDNIYLLNYESSLVVFDAKRLVWHLMPIFKSINFTSKKIKAST